MRRGITPVLLVAGGATALLRCSVESDSYEYADNAGNAGEAGASESPDPTGGSGGSVQGTSGSGGRTQGGGAAATPGGAAGEAGMGQSGSAGEGGGAQGGSAGDGGAAGAPCEEPLTDCGECVDLRTSALHCGDCNEPCETDDICAAGECALDCGALALCDEACVDLESDPNHCMDCETSCPPPAENGVAICAGADGCDIECDDTSLRCDDTCCDPPGENAMSVCSGGACDVECLPAHHACNGQSSPCYPNDDVARCGPDCDDCTQPNATSACNGTACVNTCAEVTLSCPLAQGRPSCGSWSFESGTTEGWSVDESSDSYNAWNGDFATSTFQPSAGSRALAIGFEAMAASSNYVRVRVPLCAGGQDLNLSGWVLTFMIRYVSASGFADPTDPYSYVEFIGADGYSGCDFSPTIPGWSEVTCEVNEGMATEITELGLVLRELDEPWEGTIYLDEIRLDLN